MKILNKDGLPYSIYKLFSPGVNILMIYFELSVFFESWFYLHKDKTRRNTSIWRTCGTKTIIQGFQALQRLCFRPFKVFKLCEGSSLKGC